MISSGQTVSMSRGRTAIEHDLREYEPRNVDPSMTQYNRVMVNELNGRSLAEYTNDYMKPYIEAYNAKQRRSDRKKSFDYASDYIAEQNKMAASRQNYTAGQLAYEYVIQFGDRNSMSVKEVVEDEETYKDTMAMFEEFVSKYQEYYPHMKIVLATVHMDEPNGTPHMHILVQPIGEGYKQGLSHQVSLTKALACDGFERADKKGDRLSLTRWQDDVKDEIMEPILIRHFYTREYRDGETHHMPVAMYKRVAAEAESILEDARDEAEEITDEAHIEADSVRRKTNEQKAELEELETKNEKAKESYLLIYEGGQKEDGRRILGYKELCKRHQYLMEEPERLLETEAGQKALEKAENRIVETVYQKIMTGILDFVRKSIFDEMKRYLVKPIFRAMDKMLGDHYLRLDKSDEEILTKAIGNSVDEVAESLHIGEKVKEDLEQHLSDLEEVREETQRVIRRGRHR